jgi:hypothetical protein
VQWLAEGDKCTRFFHLCACKRRKKNIITGLKRLDGSRTEDETELGTNTFYHELYTTEGQVAMQLVLDVIPKKVTAKMNLKLIAEIKESEVKEALFEMFPTDTSPTYL